MSTERRLIVNADDFGLSEGVSRGIVDAFETGVVTSASLMVRGPAAAAAGRYARAHPELSVGLHVDLAEWVFRDGGWLARYQVVPPDDAPAAAAEAARQLAAFHRLVGRDPTHLDSHQHAHRAGALEPVFADLAARLGVPLRHLDARVRYCGQFYGQTGRGEPHPAGITLERLVEIVAALRPGITELACHPGYADDLDSPYRVERIEELRVLRDPRTRAAIAAGGVELITFRALAVAG